MIKTQLVGLDAAIRAVRVVAKQIPFAASLALNKMTAEAQRTIQQSLRRNFTIAPERQEFMENFIYWGKQDKATKQKLETLLQVKGPKPKKGDDRTNILARHERGGGHARFDQFKPFFIPTRVIRPGDRDLVPRQLYPASLRLVERQGITGIAPALRGRKLSNSKRLRERGLAGRRFFVLGGPSDTTIKWGIYERVGPERGDIKLAWAFRQRITDRPHLHFVEQATQVAHDSWARHFAVALGEAMRTAR